MTTFIPILLLTTFCVVSLLSECASAKEVRRAAAWRKRRVIFNNDGNEAFITSAPATPEGYLSIRMDHIDDCGVDSVFFNPCHTINFGTLDSRVADVLTTKEGTFERNRTAALIAQGAGPLRLAVEACRRRGVEIVWSFRMNDIHDNWQTPLFTKWKRDRPHLLMGSRPDLHKYPASDPRHIWSFADYAHQEVRDQAVANVADVVNRFDVDGAELDFLRHTCLFNETRLDQPVTREHRDMLTEMVGRIHREIMAAGARKGRPILLCPHIFPTVDLNRRFGIDIERWIERGTVDALVVGGGYDPFTIPAKQMIDIGHAADIPVYVCLSLSGMAVDGVEDAQLSPQNIEAWRGAAANAWHAGADGIVSFNVFPQLPGTDQTRWAREVWQNMGDPDALVGKDKLYCIENLDFSRTSGYMMRSVPWEDRLPAPLPKGSTVKRILPVADDIPGLIDHVDTLRLRVNLVDLPANDTVGVSINGTKLTPSPEKPQWLVADVPPTVMRQGDNELAVKYTEGTADALTVAFVELHVGYGD